MKIVNSQKKNILRMVVFICLFACTFLAIADDLAQSDVLSLYEQASAKQNSGNYYDALELYRDVLHRNPDFVDAWKSFAECAYALSEYDMCLDAVEKALPYQKNNSDLQNLKAFTLIGLGRIEEAAIIFNDVLAKYPNDVQSRFGLAELDVAAGKIATAELLYRDALLRQPENRKALLSLAVLCGETGKYEIAESFINQALKYHGGDSEILYFSAWLSVKQGNLVYAEGRLRSVLALDPHNYEASSLLASILFTAGRYKESATICDEIIAEHRQSPSAWFVKALCLERQHKNQESITVYETACRLFPDDSILRSSFEMLIDRILPVEDPQRKEWALYHAKRAAGFSDSFYSDQALFEYRRALKLDPYNPQIRKNYADLLLKKNWPVRYLDQLEFAIAQGLSGKRASDAVESYTALLRDRLHHRWNVNLLSLDVAHFSVGFYYQKNALTVLHPYAESITTLLLADVLAHDGRIKTVAKSDPVDSFAEAYRLARRTGHQYFVLTLFEENEDDLKITLDIYSSRTGSKIETITVFRTGLDRYYAAIRRASRTFTALMPFHAKLLDRDGSCGIIDRGSIDGVEPKKVYTIIRKDSLSVGDNGFGFVYAEADVLGTFAVTTCDEDLAEGTISRNGFYDKIAPGDEIIFVSKENDSPVSAEQKTLGLQPDENIKTPALLRLLRSIE